MRALLPLAVAVGAAVAAMPAGAGAADAPSIAGCPIFPATNAWNQRVDHLRVAPNGATLIRSIGLDSPVHADFGSGTYDGGPIGIPYTVVPRTQPRVKTTFDYASESDRGPYPIPKNAPIEGGAKSDGDRHVIVIQRGTCKLFELYDAHPLDAGRSWHAGSGAIFNLRTGAARPKGWTSADAAGLPILPGLARYDEVAQGAITHALRFTAPKTRNTFIPPARHEASTNASPSLPPMGLRVRLRASVKITNLPRQARIVAQALKTYGMLLADNGSPWYISGAPDSHWNNDALHALGRLNASDFEVVQAPAPGVTR